MTNTKVVMENVNTGEIIEFDEFDVVEIDDDISHEEFMKELAELASDEVYSDEELFDFTDDEDE